MTFWLTVVGGISLILLWVFLPVVRGGGSVARRASHDRRIYTAQLAEIEQDLARGTLSAAEAEASRAEVSRRLLAAAQAEAAETEATLAPPRATRRLMLVSALLVPVSVLLIYAGTGRILVGTGTPPDRVVELAERLSVAVPLGAGRELRLGPVFAGLGRPGMPDLPLAARQAGLADAPGRPNQDRAEQLVAQSLPELANPDLPPELADLAGLVAQLQDLLQTRPDDLTGHQMLVQNLARLGRFAQARRAQENVLRILGPQAGAIDHADHAELMVLAANGYVSPQAAEALRQALMLDPTDGRARYFAGLSLIQDNRLAEAHQIWSRLLADGPPDAPWIAAIAAQIDELAAVAGLSTAPVPGPTADDIAAAADLTDEERALMVQDMVGRLAARLANEGGPAPDWARLITALAVTGDQTRASAILSEAREVFADHAADLAIIEQAASAAGLAP